MSHNNTKKWWDYLAQATENINNTPKDAIGGLLPSQINTPLDDPLVWQAKPDKPGLVDWRQQEKNERAYFLRRGNLRVGNLVYYDHSPKKKAFEKSTSEKVRLGKLISNWFLTNQLAILNFPKILLYYFMCNASTWQTFSNGCSL